MTGTRVRWTARDLLDADFPPPRYAVPGIVPEGLSLLVGAPKLGKSWLALGLPLASASGGRALGSVQVTAGPALYLALEDPPRRLKTRLSSLLENGAAVPAGLDLWTELPPLADSGTKEIDEWLTDNPTARLVVVDVLAKVRGSGDPRANRYDADYAVVADLKALADRHSVAMLVLHHDRKAGSDDYVDAVSGTHGLAGAADSVLVMKRSRGNADAELHITGRDIQERSLALRFAPEVGSWSLLDGPATDYTMGDSRRQILQHLRVVGGASPKQIATSLSLDYELAKKTCRRMADDEQLDTDGSGTYFPPVSPVPPVPAVPHDPYEGHEGHEGQSLWGAA